MYQIIPKSSISKIEIIYTDCTKSLQQVVSAQGCNYAINGGLYDMRTTELCSIPLRINGKTYASSSDGYWCFAWNTPKDLRMIHSKDMNKWKNVFACSAFLKDGANTIFTYNPDQGGVRGRTGFGDDANNIHLFVTTDRQGACTPESLRTQMKNNGTKNAIMLDSGGSSQGYFNGNYVQHEKRKVSWWICIWAEGSSSKNPYPTPTTTINRYSTFRSIKWLQWELVERGFLDNKNGKAIDGIFGEKTKNAVIQLQKSLGFPLKECDGLCGAQTRKAMGY